MFYGADRIEEEREVLRGRLALITTPTGLCSDGTTTIDALRRCCDLRLLLGPEHGVRGNLPDGEAFANGIDGETGLPMMSLYRKDSRHLPEEAFDLFDTLVYDVQDVGVRFYTFISSLKNAMTDCALRGKRVVVLDRPNPIGNRVEGTLRTAETESFVGCHDIPVRYGMTCGEFALMARDELRLDLDLHIVKCSGLAADMMFPDWGKAWITPSPALRTWESVVLYPGTCIFEGTNVSEGRGTAAPFRIIGAPYVSGTELADAFNSMRLSGVTAVPAEYVPASSKYAGEKCGGIELKVTDARALRSVAMGYRLLDLIRTLYPGDFGLRQYTEDPTIPFISLLAGHRRFEDLNWSLKELLAQAEKESAGFEKRRAKYVLY